MASMWKLARSVLAVVLGFVAASAVMMTIEAANGKVLYPELGQLAKGVTDRETLRTLLAGAPKGALFMVLLGWSLGSLAGGFLAACIGRNAPTTHALVLGALLTLAGLANNYMLPPPDWFRIATLLAFLPAAYLGAKLAPEMKKEQKP